MRRADSDTPAATALARQSASSAGDTRAEAVTVRRSAIRTPRHEGRGASPPPPANSAGAQTSRGSKGAEPPLARLQYHTLGKLGSRALNKPVHRRSKTWAARPPYRHSPGAGVENDDRRKRGDWLAVVSLVQAELLEWLKDPGGRLRRGSCNGKSHNAGPKQHSFSDLAAARHSIEAWKIHYNTVRRHSSPGLLSPGGSGLADAKGCEKDSRSGSLENPGRVREMFRLAGRL